MDLFWHGFYLGFGMLAALGVMLLVLGAIGLVAAALVGFGVKRAMKGRVKPQGR